MFDFVRVGSGVPDIEIGNVEFNVEQIIKKASDAKEGNVDVLAFPELSLTGYTCADLFFQDTLLNNVKEGIKTIVEKSTEWDITLAVGAPICINGQLYNCAVLINRGRILGIVPKTFLPNYSEYYEKRWFSSSVDLVQKTISSKAFNLCAEYDIPVGRNLIFNINDKVKIAVEICEDLWSPLPPSTFLTLNGAEVILNLSASNETISKRAYRKELVCHQSARSFCAYVYSSAGQTESTTDLVFSGHSLIAENGVLLKQNENFMDSDYMIVSDVDLGKIRSDRKKNKSFKDSATLYGTKEESRVIDCYTENTDDFTTKAEKYNVYKLPFVPSNKKDRLKRCQNIFDMQVAGLKKRILTTNSKLVIGVSGGLDSTLALLVCTEALKELGRPMTDVYGITMPCFGTSGRTYNNAVKLMQSLKISAKEIDIKEACVKHYEDIGHDINVHDVTFENVQARERTQVLMDFASEIGAFVVGTGDLSELALGFCTYNADHMSMYGVNAGVPKTLIKWLIDSVIKYDTFADSTEILKDIIDTPISPELLPPDSKGAIAQETENIIGPYSLHDFFLYYLVRFGFTPEKIFHLAKKAFAGEFDAETIIKWQKMFYRRFFTQQFKRNCMPDGVKIGNICLSPRGDWRMPSDATFKMWLNEIEKITL